VSLQGTYALAAQNIPDLDCVNIVTRPGLRACAYLAFKVVISCEQQSAGNGEGDGGDAANGLGDLKGVLSVFACMRENQKREEVEIKGREKLGWEGAYLVCGELTVGANVEQTAGSVV
jgi:hypothetical protein